ncbi:hypothetical protein BDW71DRAFT_154216 [Aspergillus fruticulosus]
MMRLTTLPPGLCLRSPWLLLTYIVFKIYQIYSDFEDIKRHQCRLKCQSSHPTINPTEQQPCRESSTTEGPTPLALATTYKTRPLDRACISYVLWGWQALSFYGCNEDFPSAEFVILDEHVNAAVAAFVVDGERQCMNLNCQENRPDRTRCLAPHVTRPARDRYHTVGHAHFHIVDNTSQQQSTENPSLSGGCMMRTSLSALLFLISLG